MNILSKNLTDETESKQLKTIFNQYFLTLLTNKESMSTSTFETNTNIVFLVDDNSVDNFVHKKMIELNKFASQVRIFINAKDALYYLSEIDDLSYNEHTIPSIIFLDLNMPLINGFQFLELYEKLPSIIHSKCKIVILTNSLNPADRVQAKANKHIITFINKPLSSDHFAELNELLESNFTQTSQP